MATKIKRKVFVYKETEGNVLDYTAMFHQWGIGMVWYIQGTVNCSIAIVEKSNGEIRQVLPNRIQFV